MAQAPATQPSLLLRLRDPQDEKAWAQFVDLYAPLVYGYARKQGLQDADAADLSQAVLSSVASAIGRLDYDPRRGSFRGWLFTIVRNKLANFLRRDGCQRGAGDTATQRLLERHPAPEDESSAWNAEYDQRLFAWAAEQVRSQVQPTTWQAFWQTAVEGKAGKEVAAVLGISLAAVRLAKSRVLARLKAVVRQAEDSEVFPHR